MKQKGFPSSVAQPIRLHVNAKRYLTADGVEGSAEYRAKLSAASTRSLEVQGGPLTAEEAEVRTQLIAAALAIDPVSLSSAETEHGTPQIPQPRSATDRLISGRQRRGASRGSRGTQLSLSSHPRCSSARGR